MKQITRDLMMRGLFPAELVPAFNSLKLGPALKDIETLQSRKIPFASPCGTFSIPRAGGVRRLLSIPNPLHQFRLAKEIGESWSKFQKHYKSSSLAISRPKHQLNKHRPIVTELSLSELTLQKITKSSGGSFLLRTDISDYYSSIYTHSLPWALHGKQTAKRRRRDTKLMGNRLDTAVRNTQDSQTLGIPTGPDTSLAVSEILGSRFDQEIQNSCKFINGFRYVDDYYLFFADRVEAQRALAKIQSLISDFGLQLSPGKTGIFELPSEVEPRWVYALRVFELHGEAVKTADLISYFNTALVYAGEFPDDLVLKYALGRLRHLQSTMQNWEVYEAILLACMQSEAACLPLVVEALVQGTRTHKPINLKKVREAFLLFLLKHANSSHAYEISWALWLCKLLKLRLTETVTRALLAIDQPIVALLCLDLNSRGLLPKKSQFDLWATHSTGHDLYTEFWLLAYEASMKGWLPGKRTTHIARDPFFSILKNNSVSFYDETFAILPLGSTGPRWNRPADPDDDDYEDGIEWPGVGLLGYHD